MVECACLENRYTGNGIAGSNPVPSAMPVWLSRPENPDTYVGVTHYFDVRQNALHSHVSQVGERNEERDARSRERLGAIGEKIGVPLAEQFMRRKIHRQDQQAADTQECLKR